MCGKGGRDGSVPRNSTQRKREIKKYVTGWLLVGPHKFGEHCAPIGADQNLPFCQIGPTFFAVFPPTFPVGGTWACQGTGKCVCAQGHVISLFCPSQSTLLLTPLSLSPSRPPCSLLCRLSRRHSSTAQLTNNVGKLVPET